MIALTRLVDLKLLFGKIKNLNYNLLRAPNSQDLPNNYNYLTFGINIIERKKMIKFENIVGKKPMFTILDKFESIDINDKIDFIMAQSIYKKFKILLIFKNLY